MSWETNELDTQYEDKLRTERREELEAEIERLRSAIQDALTDISDDSYNAAYITLKNCLEDRK